jgi:dihydroorotase-like cyclic amidohydrolase
MPCTSIPPVTNNENLQRKLREISGKGIVDYGLFGGILKPWRSFQIGYLASSATSYRECLHSAG